MKRNGPLNGSGPSADNLRNGGQRPHSRSDAGRASLISSSSQSLLKPRSPAAETAVSVVLKARGGSRFDVSLDDVQLVKSSAQPICNAARVLHRLGYSDACRLIAWHEGSDHHAISGRLGFWRKRRIREDRGLPRYVAWEPLPRRVGVKKGRGKFKGVRSRTKKKNASTATPGADKGHDKARRKAIRRPKEQS
jgi:hypothetical protein